MEWKRELIILRIRLGRLWHILCVVMGLDISLATPVIIVTQFASTSISKEVIFATTTEPVCLKGGVPVRMVILGGTARILARAT